MEVLLLILGALVLAASLSVVVWLPLFLRMPASRAESLSRIGGCFGGYVEPMTLQGFVYIKADENKIRVRTPLRRIVFDYQDIDEIAFVKFWGQKCLKISSKAAKVPTMLINGYKRDALARFIEMRAPRLILEDHSDRNWYES